MKEEEVYKEEFVDEEVTAQEAITAAKNIGLYMVLIVVLVVGGLFVLSSVVGSVSP